MNRQIISLKFTQMSRIYLSIDLSIRPRGDSHCWQGDQMPGKLTLSPDSFFVARNSLKYGEKSYCIAYFNEFYPTFSQNRVKIGPKFVL